MNSILRLRKRNEQYTIYDLWIGEYIMSVTSLHPNQLTIGHKHEWEEVYYVASGFGRMLLDTTYIIITPGQFIKIPPDTFHRLYNDDKVGELVVVCVFQGKKEEDESL